MNLKFFIIFLFPLFLLAKEELIHIYSYEIDATSRKIVSKKRVVVEYKDYYIEADKAIYDRKTKLIKLFGDITVIKGEQYSALSDFALFDMEQDKFLAKPFFFAEYSSNIWMAGTRYKSDKEIIKLSNTFLSSCDVNCSDWKFYVQSGNYLPKKHWINLYNSRLFIKDIPVFYFPYLGFSTQKKRKTGFLKPSFALSKDEGFIYLQPYFLAPQNWWDLEFDPQIRTKRGWGLFTTLRFIDTLYSYGEVTTGIFKEKTSYKQNRNLKNTHHHGLDIYYRRKYLLTKPKDKANDSLYINIKSYNDIDFFNLQKYSKTFSIDPILISRFNYYFDKQKDFFGVYGRYFKDNRKVDNSDTLQTLPTLHYHHYLTSLFDEHLNYQIDAKLSYYYRKKGLKALEYQFSLPIRWQDTFFDQSVGYSISEKLFADYADYSHKTEYIKNYSLYRNAHEISLFTDLVKPYKDFIHTLHLNATLFIPSFEKEKGSREDFINIEDINKQLQLSLEHYFYQDGQEVLYHRFSQPINYDASKKLGEMENEIGISYKNVRVSSDIFYSYYQRSIRTITTSLDYKASQNSIQLSHFYKNRTKEPDSNILNLSFEHILSKQDKLFATINYDFYEKYANRWRIGWNRDKRCWGMTLSFKEERVPLLTTQGSSSYKNRTIFLNIELYPIGGISKSIITQDEQRNL